MERENDRLRDNGTWMMCGRGATALPVRKRLDHRGPLSIDVSGAWYFITICAEGHKPWVATKWPEYDMDGARSARGADPTEDRGQLQTSAGGKVWIAVSTGFLGHTSARRGALCREVPLCLQQSRAEAAVRDGEELAAVDCV